VGTALTGGAEEPVTITKIVLGSDGGELAGSSHVVRVVSSRLACRTREHAAGCGLGTVADADFNVVHHPRSRVGRFVTRQGRTVSSSFLHGGRCAGCAASAAEVCTFCRPGAVLHAAGGFPPRRNHLWLFFILPILFSIHLGSS
jgi:hypothetical protein